MKKFLLALVVLSGAAFSSFAQSGKDGGKFSIGLEAGLPIGDAADGYSFAIGGSLKYDHPLSEGLFVTVSAGYTSLTGKTITVEVEGEEFSGKVPAFGVVPVKAGLKYFFSEGFYGEAQAGAAFGTSEGAGTAFLYSPGIGYNFSENVDAGVRYEAWTKDGGTTSIIGLRVAYSF